MVKVIIGLGIRRSAQKFVYRCRRSGMAVRRSTAGSETMAPRAVVDVESLGQCCIKRKTKIFAYMFRIKLESQRGLKL